MSTYQVTGRVDTVALRTSYGIMAGSCEIPQFRVDADSDEEAAELAQDIIDPLHMTTVHITIEKET